MFGLTGTGQMVLALVVCMGYVAGGLTGVALGVGIFFTVLLLASACS